MSEQETVEKEEEKTESEQKEEEVVKEPLTKEEIVQKVILEHYGTVVLHDIDETAKVEDATIIVPTDRKIEHGGRSVPLIHALSAREENLEKIKKVLGGDYVMEGHVVKVASEKIPKVVDSFALVLNDLEKKLKEVEKVIEKELEETEVEEKVEKKIKGKTEEVGI